MKGFVTIATGSEEYFKMATNLLFSYRYFTKEPYPFAIITDRENEYTKCFDKVVILENAQCSFMDKINLLAYAPFDENIFIDADCLAYADLNDYWPYFSDASDFSAFGDMRSLSVQGTFYDYEGAGIFKDKISYITHLHGGLYFIRKSNKCQELLSTCNYIIDHYDDFTFKMFNDKPADETVFALAMSVHNMRVVEYRPEFMCFYPSNTYFKCDISQPCLEYSMPWFPDKKIVNNGYCVHWANFNIPKPIYQLEAYRLHCMVKRIPITSFNLLCKKTIAALSYIALRIKNKILCL